jgi:hypothetical protein
MLIFCGFKSDKRSVGPPTSVGARGWCPHQPLERSVIFDGLKSICLLYLCLTVCSFESNAQESKPRQLAETYFAQKAYTAAIPYYRKVIKQDTKNDSVFTKLAYCYFYTRQLPAARKVFQYLTQEKKLTEAHLPLYFEVLKQLGQYKEAKKLVSKSKKEDWLTKIQSCDSAMAWLKKTKPVKVTNLKSINTEYSDKSPAFHPKGLLFLSNRETTFIEKPTGYDGLPTFDMYLANYNNDSVPSFPRPFANLQNSNYHEGEVFYAADTSFVYFSGLKKDKDNVLRMKLYESEIKKGKPKKVKSFVFNDSLCSFMHPCTDITNQLFFFSSNMPGGFGGMDLYVSIKIDSAWQDPINLGATINTEYNEIHPFFDSNHHLYFSSDRPTGMGGFDNYVVSEKNGRWGTSQNLRTPINSCNDDMGFVLNRNQSTAYFYSNRVGGFGKEDVYKVTGKLFLLLDK